MTKTDLAVIGGTVVNADSTEQATVLVHAGRVTALLPADRKLPPAQEVVNAAGRLVLPGGVDPHTHIAMSIGEHTTLDGYAEVTRAAVWGGTTTIVDFAIPRPGETPLEAVQQRRLAARSGVCDAALHACVVNWDDSIPDQLRQIADLGVRTVKLFTTYRDMVMAQPSTVRKVMRELRALGGLAYVHAEDNDLIEADQEQAERAGRIDASGHSCTRSELAEVTAVREVLSSARSLGAPVYFVHQSTPAAIAEVRRARDEGAVAYTETCPHYLALTDELYAGEDAELFVCCPPLRSPDTVAGVVGRALAADVDTVGSDHCCYDRAQKRAGRSDVRIMPNGMPGVETRLPVTFTELVIRRGLPVQRFVALTAANPARLNGIHPQKGVIAPGCDADLILMDPLERRTVHAGSLHMATDYTPYEGRELAGWPSTVIVGGAVVIDGGAVVNDSPRGRALISAPLPQDRIVC